MLSKNLLCTNDNIIVQSDFQQLQGFLRGLFKGLHSLRGLEKVYKFRDSFLKTYK